MFYEQFIYLACSFAETLSNIYQSYFMLVSRIIHIMFMNYNPHMFQSILQSSFESSGKFKNILHYSSDFFEFPANSRKFYVFLVNSKISQMFLRCFQILSLQIVVVTTACDVMCVQYVHKQPPEVFFKKGVLKNFAKLTGKQLY